MLEATNVVVTFSDLFITVIMREMWMLLTFAAVALANTIPDEVVTLTYNDPLLEDGAKMDVHINAAEETIRFHMADQGSLGDVDTIEDYSVGFAASRVDEEQACFIRKLKSTLEESAALAHKLASSGPQESQGTEEVLAVPEEETDEWGSRIREHCGDYEIYKLVKTEEDVEAEATDGNAVMSPADNSPQNRQTTIVFRRCFIFFFFFKCITTTITVPTGTTIIFFFFG